MNTLNNGWDVIIALGALLLGLYSALSVAFSKSLSVREHDEFRENVNNAIDELRDQNRRDIDRVEHLVQLIIQTRPTVDQLKETADSFKDQLKELKDHVWEVSHNGKESKMK